MQAIGFFAFWSGCRRKRMFFAVFFIIITLMQTTFGLGIASKVAIDSFAPVQCYPPRSRHHVRSSAKLSFPLTLATNADMGTAHSTTEETLMKIHFVTLPGVSLDDAAEAVSQFCQSFPFAAVLPVQPLQYVPTSDGGVEIKFLRKKTETKSGVDGGIRFSLLKSPFHQPKTVNEYRRGDGGELELTAKRNSQGQSIPKIMSEKLVIKAFTTSILQNHDPSPTATPLSSVKSRLTITSIFHKWM